MTVVEPAHFSELPNYHADVMEELVDARQQAFNKYFDNYIDPYTDDLLAPLDQVAEGAREIFVDFAGKIVTAATLAREWGYLLLPDEARNTLFKSGRLTVGDGHRLLIEHMQIPVKIDAEPTKDPEDPRHKMNELVVATLLVANDSIVLNTGFKRDPYTYKELARRFASPQGSLALLTALDVRLLDLAEKVGGAEGASMVREHATAITEARIVHDPVLLRDSRVKGPIGMATMLREYAATPGTKAKMLEESDKVLSAHAMHTKILGRAGQLMMAAESPDVRKSIEVVNKWQLREFIAGKTVAEVELNLEWLGYDLTAEELAELKREVGRCWADRITQQINYERIALPALEEELRELSAHKLRGRQKRQRNQEIEAKTAKSDEQERKIVELYAQLHKVNAAFADDLVIDSVN